MTPAIRTCERTDHTVICPERKAAEIMGTFWRAGDGTYIWVGAGRMGTVRCCPWCFRDLPDGPFPCPKETAMKAKTAGKGKVVSRRYPALPTTVQSAGGTLTVQLVAEIKPDEPGEDILGHFDPSTRHILIKKSLRGDQQWLVYFHEITHAALWDSGAHNALTGAAEEIVCDAVATSRLREKFG